MITLVQAIILAAGKSTRFKTEKSKLLEPICGQPMVAYPIKLLQALSIPVTLVVGHKKEEIIETVTNALSANPASSPVSYITQEKQEGTGHALLCTRENWKSEHILVINGDMPLITAEIIADLYKKHLETKAAMSFVTAHYSDAAVSAYGRVVQKGSSIEIIEAKNWVAENSSATSSGEFSADSCCINAGIYLISRDFLEKHVTSLEKNSVTKEFYLTDLVKIASQNGLTVSTLQAPFDRIRGINTLQELWATEQIQRADLIKYWMERGVRFSVPQNVHINLDVTIGAGTFIGCGVQLTGNTTIGSNCVINEFNSLNNVTLGNNVTINSHCIINDAVIHDSAQVGPFAHIRNNSTIHAHSVIGNFVEVKNSIIGEHTKAKHLTFLGDATIGNRVNIGAGTITCNYDGAKKHRTTIEDNTFIGSNNTLVAPIIIGKNSFTAAGSTITEHVPENTLAFGRARQVNKEGYRKNSSQDSQNSQDINSPNNNNNNSDPKNNVSGSGASHSFIGAVKTNSNAGSGSRFE
jgi:bifunctional UDP-N-acetylglucosamine pyrophosphorylase/glucosamine-1-phosphate N-acetyltransferase